MPELPELETIAQQLSSIMPFHTKTAAVSPGFVRNIQKTNLHFDKHLSNRTIYSVQRIGKFLAFVLDKEEFLISHLGMSGSWLIDPQGNSKHHHLTFTSKNSALTLVYNDPRRFGKAKILSNDEYYRYIGSLQPDIHSDTFTLKHFCHLLQKVRKTTLKTAFLNQKYFPGCGNYLANEFCARARIHPTRLCGDISQYEQKNLFNAIKETLALSIAHGGATFLGGYRNAHGDKGQALLTLVVYRQEICGLCKIEKVTHMSLNQRATYFCSSCQK